jgi:uncharacterized protein (DUF58 family)
MEANKNQVRELGPPPRGVALLLRLQLLFGGILGLMGWILFAAGILFSLLFFVLFQVDTQFYRWRGSLETARGTILRSERTHISDKRGTRRTYYYRFHYAFVAKDGVRRTGSSVAKHVRYKPGSRVTVEYPRGDPGVSRILGMQRSVGGSWFFLLLLLPLAGVILATIGLLLGWRKIALLRHGMPAKGHLVGKDVTAMKVNNKRVYRMTFEFQTPDGRTHRASSRTNAPEELEDDVFERLLYRESNPTRAVLLDALPGSPDIDAAGSFTTGSSLLPKLTLIPPLAAIPATALMLLWILLG